MAGTGLGRTDNIGDNETPTSADFVNVGGPVAQVDGGFNHTCALLTTGALRCWGEGSSWKLGYGVYISVGDNETPASMGDVPYR